MTNISLLIKKLMIWFCLAVIALLLGLHLLEAFFINQANLWLLRGLLNSAISIEEYPHWQVNSEQAEWVRAQNAFALATNLPWRSDVAQWGYGRVALVQGQASVAARWLPVDGPGVASNPLLFLDTLVAHSQAGNDLDVLRLYAQRPAILDQASEFDVRVVSETVALVYLKKAHAYIEAGQLSEATADLRTVLLFRPFDLYANYYLWFYAQQQNDEVATDYYQRLSHFPVQAVEARDPRLLAYTLEIFPYLLSNDIWGYERSQHLVAYWVWRYSGLLALRQLLEKLIGQFPAENKWRFYLAELDQRQRRWESAKQRYQQIVLEGGNAAALAQARLDQIARERGPSTPLLGLAESDQEVVARLLNVPIESVQFDANLLQADLLSDVSVLPPSGWGYGPLQEGDLWQFTSGRDSLERSGSVRLTNLWWPERSQVSGAMPFAQYRSRPFTVSGGWLMISAWYKVQGDGIGLLAVGTTNGAGQTLFFTHTPLAETDGLWAKIVVVGRISQISNPWFIILRNWGAGDVWFQGVNVRSVSIASTPAQCLDVACVVVAPNN